MKRLLLLITPIFVLGGFLAQQSSNLIIFAEDATPFYAIVNGIKQNSEPQTNVKITGLTNPANQVKVVFSNPAIPALDKQIYFQEMNVEATMKISNTKNGYKLRYFGEVSMGAAPPDASQNIITYHTEEPVVTTAPATTVVSTTPVTTTPVTTTTTVVEETVITTNGTSVTPVTNTTTQTTTGTGENVNVNMNVGVPGFNMNVSMNVPDETVTTTSTNYPNTTMDVNTTGGTSSAVYTTTTTTTTTTGGNTNVIYEEPAPAPAPMSYVDGYSGAVGCAIPMSSMTSIKNAIDNESFSEDKMRVAKQAVKNKCLTTSQVIELVGLFDFEDDKLEFAKHAYGSTYDVDNYYQVNSAFSFSASKKELDEYIQSR